MTSTTYTSPGGFSNAMRNTWAWIKKIPPVYPVFLIIFIVLGFLNPVKYQSMNGIMTFLRTASPLAVIAVGEMFVLAIGGFDLTVGAIVTFVVLVSSKVLANDPANAYPAILLMLGIGVLIGFLNGVIVSYLKVPSFITTLGMMLLVRGAALYYVGGAPQGYLTDNWRAFGRNYIENVPLFGRVPYGLIVLIIVAFIAIMLFNRMNFGKEILAIGDNVRASQLSGVRVRLVRVLTFILCAVFAIIGGIMTGGYGGVNVTIGEGYEMNAIAACVVGGVLLGGGKGSVLNVIFGAFTLQAIVNLLNMLGLPKPYTDVVQGLIIIGAVAYVGLSSQRKK
ncbi:MAG: ABC transporter permease [Anaerolineales bacterium]|nr:ABC transporter permease [Anaerolineae bacterium]PWB56596.1 MAG: ABC transporter permease [Anaerolineales bacterium]